MTDKKKKIIIGVAAAVVVLIAIIIAVFAIKGNKKADDVNAEITQDIVNEIITTEQPESEAAAITTEAATTATVTTTEATTVAPTTEATPTSKTISKTNAQIAEMYNNALSGVKANATSLTREYKKLSSLPEYLELPSAIKSIGSAAISQFVKGTDTPETWTSKEDMKIIFPAGGTDYCSKISADMIESATCVDTGSEYELEIKLYDDKITSPNKGEGYAGAFNTVTASSIKEVSIPMVTFNKIDVKGINGSISAKIDKASGRVTDITFRNTDILSMNVKVALSDVSAQIALAVEENFKIKY